jgi:hypothetical protein
MPASGSRTSDGLDASELPRAEGVEHAPNVRVDRLERIGLVVCVARHRRHLGRHVGSLGQRQHLVEGGEVLRLERCMYSWWNSTIAGMPSLSISPHTQSNLPSSRGWRSTGVWNVNRMPSMPGCFFQSLIVSRPASRGRSGPSWRSGRDDCWQQRWQGRCGRPPTTAARSPRGPRRPCPSRRTALPCRAVGDGVPRDWATAGAAGGPDVDLCVANHHGRRFLQGRACSSCAASEYSVSSPP